MINAPGKIFTLRFMEEKTKSRKSQKEENENFDFKERLREYNRLIESSDSDAKY